MEKKIVLFLMMMLSALAIGAQEETPNAKQARRIMNTAYDRVFGPHGSTLTYHVNIIGLYKTPGPIWFKEKKQRFTDERVDTWNDGKTAYNLWYQPISAQVLWCHIVQQFFTIGSTDMIFGTISHHLSVKTQGNLSFDTLECSTTYEEDVLGIYWYHLLFRMLTTSLWWHINN